MRTLTVLVIVLSARAAWADENPHLTRAGQHYSALEYREADAALELAWKDPRNTREQVLEILKLQGTVAASLGQSTKATTVFLKLLTIDPDARLADGLPPRVMTPYFEAKGRLTEKGPLKLKSAVAREADGKARLTLDVAADALGLVKKARFHYRAGDADRGEVTVDALPAIVAVEGTPIGWWVEALNEFDGVLAVLGSEAAPLPGPEGTVQPPPLVAGPPPAPKPEVQSGPATPLSGTRVVSFLVLGAGLGTGVAGTILGVQAGGLKQRLDTLPTDARGQVTGMTQKEAYELDAQQRGLATGANVLWISAGVLAATGVVLFIAGAAPAVTPTVSVGPNGASLGVAGAF